MMKDKLIKAEDLKGTKADLFQDLVAEGVTFDYALPQVWLNEFSDWCRRHYPSVTYGLILTTTVWGYGEKRQGPIFRCREVFEAYSRWVNKRDFV